jgi:prepilin-type N-terminal cleavage/methylation domain-containing protein/prepilin-type processing-associated H-X9-DG protein
MSIEHASAPIRSRHATRPKARRRGITLVEVLVTISLIAILSAMLLPALGMAREAARKSSCMTNLASIAKAFSAYDAAKGQLPGWRNTQITYSTTMRDSSPTKARVSWTVTVMPFLGEREIFAWYEDYPKWADPVANKRIPRYICPSLAVEQREQYPASIAYVGNAGTGGPQDGKQYRGDGVLVDTVNNADERSPRTYSGTTYSLEAIGAADGESSTALLAERTGLAVPKGLKWSDHPVPATENGPAAPEAHVFLQPPGSPPTQASSADPKTGNTWMRLAVDMGLRYPSSCHGRGYQLAFCDGHTRTISDAIDWWVYSQLLSSDQSARSRRVRGQSNQPGWEDYYVNGQRVHYILDDKDVDKK